MDWLNGSRWLRPVVNIKIFNVQLKIAPHNIMEIHCPREKQEYIRFVIWVKILLICLNFTVSWRCW